MSRAFVLGGLLLTMSSCGLFLDGVYLLSSKRTTQDVEQRRPTGQSQLEPERRLTFDGPRVHVVCEDVTRGVDRVWTVHKTFEHQGGWYQVHWLPVILEGLIGAGLGIGFGAKCADPSSGVSCDLLYSTIPFAVDVTYSLVRLLTIDPPKLVDKQLTQPHTGPHPTPLQTTTTACEADAEIVATASTSGGPLRVPVDASGWIAEADQQRLLTFALGYRDANIAVYGGGRQLGVDFNRCNFLRLQATANQGRSALPADCQ